MAAAKKQSSTRRLSRGNRVIAFIQTWCKVPEGKDVGKPIKLNRFQRRFIIAVYDNPHKTRRAILSMARKNGKTVLIACLVLAHLVGPEALENTQIVSGAQSREQAALVFDAAVKMVLLSEDLSSIVRIIPSSKRLIGLPMGVEYRALAAEAKTSHGLSPVVAILDEVGQVRGTRDDFIDAIVTSQGAHESPLLFAISTQAANDADLLSVWIDDALTSNDLHTVCHLYAAPDDCSIMDKKAWRMANPALGRFRSMQDLAAMAMQAMRMPSFENTFRNLGLNQRISTNSPFISRDVWKENGGALIPLADCDEVYGGLDLSMRTDLTAAIFDGVKDGRHYLHCYFWTPESTLLDRAKRDRSPYDLWVKQGHLMTTPGSTVDYGFVAQQVADVVASLTNFKGMAYDRWRIEILRKEFERIGADVNLVEWGQGFKDMSPAIEATEALLLNGMVSHNNNPVLTMCAVNSSIVRDPAGNRKLDKSKPTGRIDGMVAAAMAAGLSQRTLEGDGIDIDDFLNDPIIG